MSKVDGTTSTTAAVRGEAPARNDAAIARDASRRPTNAAEIREAPRTVGLDSRYDRFFA